MSSHIRFGTVEALANWRQATLMSGLKAVTQLYWRAGFRVTQALMDGKFEPMRGELAGIGVELVLLWCGDWVVVIQLAVT